MLRLIMFTIMVLALGCAGPKSGDAPAATCQMEASAYQITYPDGQIRKSDVIVCSDGCTRYTSVDDAAVTFVTCR